MKRSAGIVGALGLVGMGWLLLSGGAPGVRDGNAETLARGRAIYEAECATCHGSDLQGQPNWRDRLPSGRLPAPPHDASGHTWHHPDSVLFRIVKEGTAAIVGGGYESDMPGFGGRLSDAEIRAVLAFIRSTWPERERAFQERASEAVERSQ